MVPCAQAMTPRPRAPTTYRQGGIALSADVQLQKSVTQHPYNAPLGSTYKLHSLSATGQSPAARRATRES